MNETQGDVRHEDVYLLARHLARRLGALQVIEIGSGTGLDLAKLHPEFTVVGIDEAGLVSRSRSRYPWATWLEWSPGAPLPEMFTDLLAKHRLRLPHSVIVCHDLGRWQDEGPVAEALHELLEYSPAAVVSTSTGGDTSADRFEHLLGRAGCRVEFFGSTTSARDSALLGGEELARLPDEELLANVEVPAVLRAPPRPLAVLVNNHVPRFEPAPPGFRVVAIVAVRNEDDILEPCIQTLRSEGVDVYILDNWSTDRSAAIAESLVGNGVIGIERFPATGPSDTWDWARMLQRMEAIATEVAADWYLHTDVDEVRRSPWPDASLRDALFHVGRQGYNVVDYTELAFRPLDEGYRAGSSLEEHFRHYAFDQSVDNQYKTWKSTGVRVYLARSGHDATFSGRRVYPCNFLFKHYPIRSQAHGEQKVRSRMARLAGEERDLGWHAHLNEQASFETFLRDPARLRVFDESYYRTNLVELLAAVGPSARAAWRSSSPDGRSGRRMRATPRRAASGLRAVAHKTRLLMPFVV
jgi:hypothetical protein